MAAPAVPQNSLSLLVNEPTHITFGPYSIDVTPLTVGELPAVLRHAGPILNMLATVRSQEDAVALVLDHGEAIIEIVALAARLPGDQVRALTPDLMGELFFGLIEVNGDFFVRRMKPLSERALAVMARLQGEAASSANTGAPASTDSTGQPSSPA